MKLTIQDGLPYVDVSLTYRGNILLLNKVILDTGSVSSVFSADRVASIGLLPALEDSLDRIRGIGGSEIVFQKRVDRLAMGDLQLDNFQIEVGAMRYGFEIEAIIGFDFLTQARAIIDLDLLEVRRS